MYWWCWSPLQLAKPSQSPQAFRHRHHRLVGRPKVWAVTTPTPWAIGTLCILHRCHNRVYESQTSVNVLVWIAFTSVPHTATTTPTLASHVTHPWRPRAWLQRRFPSLPTFPMQTCLRCMHSSMIRCGQCTMACKDRTGHMRATGVGNCPISASTMVWHVTLMATLHFCTHALCLLTPGCISQSWWHGSVCVAALVRGVVCVCVARLSELLFWFVVRLAGFCLGTTCAV